MTTISAAKAPSPLEEIRFLKNERDLASEIYTKTLEVIDGLRVKQISPESPCQYMLNRLRTTNALAGNRLAALSQEIDAKTSACISYEGADLNALQVILSSDPRGDQSLGNVCVTSILSHRDPVTRAKL